jgi:aryl-alcohol dehydrogenase-like predicted oxidoreductase
MEKRKLGQGLEVTALSLGAMATANPATSPIGRK